MTGALPVDVAQVSAPVPVLREVTLRTSPDKAPLVNCTKYLPAAKVDRLDRSPPVAVKPVVLVLPATVPVAAAMVKLGKVH